MYDEMKDKNEVISLSQVNKTEGDEADARADEDIAERSALIFPGEKKEDSDGAEPTLKEPDRMDAESEDSGSFYSSARLFGKSEEEMTSEFKSYKAKKLLNKISLMLTDPYLPLPEFEEKLSKAMSLGLKGATVLFDRAEYAVRRAGVAFPINVCVCYPFASDDFKAKAVAIKRALRLPINAIEIPINLTDVSERNVRKVESEYRRLRRLVGRRGFVLIAEVSSMSPTDMSLLARICKNAGIDAIKTSCAFKNSRIDDIALNNLKAILGESVTLVACSSTDDDREVVGVFAVGAVEFSGTQAIELSESLKRTILS